MTVLGGHLYSTPAVAVRELVQNAHDSITRRRIEEPQFTDGRIDVLGDRRRDADRPRRRRGHDARARSTSSWPRSASATRAACASAQSRRADRPVRARLPVGVHHRRAHDRAHASYQAAGRGARVPQHHRRALQRRGDRAARDRDRGRVAAGRGALRRSRDPETLDATVSRYCALLGIPVFVNGEQVNADAAAVARRRRDAARHPVQRRKRAREFAERMDPSFRPLCTLPVDAGGVRGLLWVQDAQTYGSWDNRRLAVYVRGMLLDDDARDLLPRWAGFVSGAVESDVADADREPRGPAARRRLGSRAARRCGTRWSTGMAQRGRRAAGGVGARARPPQRGAARRRARRRAARRAARRRPPGAHQRGRPDRARAGRGRRAARRTSGSARAASRRCASAR